MAIAEDMKKLTENIIFSNDVRVKALGDLVADTHETLRGFATDRKKMAVEQAKDLAGFVKGLVKDVGDMLKRFQKEHRDMSSALSKSLSDFVMDLAKDVGSMMKNIQKMHKEMAENLKKNLEKGETERLKDFQKMMSDIQKGIKEIETFVANKLKEFNNDHADMSEALKKELNGYVMGIVKETRGFLKECGSEMSQARKAWQGMSATMAKARKSGFKIDAGKKVTTVGHGNKRNARKSKSSRQKVGVGV
jgi:phage host-nuclease inhibitor protein Gam